MNRKSQSVRSRSRSPTPAWRPSTPARVQFCPYWIATQGVCQAGAACGFQHPYWRVNKTHLARRQDYLIRQLNEVNEKLVNMEINKTKMMEKDDRK